MLDILPHELENNIKNEIKAMTDIMPKCIFINKNICLLQVFLKHKKSRISELVESVECRV